MCIAGESYCVDACDNESDIYVDACYTVCYFCYGREYTHELYSLCFGICEQYRLDGNTRSKYLLGICPNATEQP